MSNSQEVKSIHDKYNSLSPYWNEKTRRLWAAIEARSLGWGGISQVAVATGLSRTTIHAGIRLLLDEEGSETSNEDSKRIRSSGAGRKLLARLDLNPYQTGIKVTDTELDTIAIERNSFHGEWNYIIKPKVVA